MSPLARLGAPAGPDTRCQVRIVAGRLTGLHVADTPELAETFAHVIRAAHPDAQITITPLGKTTRKEPTSS